jgi:alkylated DNA repair protein alkB family protein 1
MYSNEEEERVPTSNLFKDSFKKYKSRKKDLDLDEVVDFHAYHDHHKKRVEKPSEIDDVIRSNSMSGIYEDVSAMDISCHNLNKAKFHECKSSNFGLACPSQWGVYCHKQLPGLVFIVDPFVDLKSKQYWIEQCLTKYHCKPNVCNLDAHCERTSDLWMDFVSAMNHGGQINRMEFFKLRWVTLGFHYDWNTKLYYKDRYTEFPEDLYNLSKYLAEQLGYSYYSAEAGIVNYYHLDSTLAGHTDHSEYDMDSPLFSISFGCDAIFLIGGETKSIRPVPIYLRSGDIVVMAGESRLAYHGVPKILPCNNKNLSEPDIADNDSGTNWVDEYMKQSRININIRQVLKEGQEFPETESF